MSSDLTLVRFKDPNEALGLALPFNGTALATSDERAELAAIDPPPPPLRFLH